MSAGVFGIATIIGIFLWWAMSILGAGERR